LPDDWNIQQPDESRAAATHAMFAVGPLGGSSRHDHQRGRVSGLVGWLLVAVAAVGLFASTPPSAGPDEQAHEVTAWYLSEHGLPPSSAAWFSVPASLWWSSVDVANPCYSFHQEVTADCMPPRSTRTGMVSLPTSWVVNYPPPYYWVVGVGQRFATLFGNEYADVGGRLASIALDLGVLLLLSLYMRRRNSWWGNFLLLVSTPMAVFLGIVVNPSGWEIVCALVLAAALSETAWSPRPMGSGNWSRTTTLVLVLASLGLSTARPLGFMWVTGLTVSAIALAPFMIRRVLAVRLLCAVGPGIVIGILWLATHRGLGSPSTVAGSDTILGLSRTFADSLLYFPNRLHAMFGVLGWQDTPMPDLLFLLNIAAWSALLTRLPSIRKAAVVCGILGIVIVPSAIEVLGWAAWPLWWQGRYTMPFALGFVLLLLLRSGRFIPRAISIVSGVCTLSLAVMVWVNAARYSFGLDGYGLPGSLGTPGINPVRLGVSAVAGGLLILGSGYLLVQAWRMPPDLVSGVAPDVSSAPAPGVDAGLILTP
jgi:hypothetical protein